MLAAAQAGDEPTASVVLDIAPSERVASMLGDLQSSNGDVGSTPTPGTGIPGTGANQPGSSDPMSSSTGGGSHPRDRVMDPESPYYQGKDRTGGGTGGGGTSVIEPTQESDTYWLQHTGFRR